MQSCKSAQTQHDPNSMIQTVLVLGGSSEIAHALLVELQAQGLNKAVLAVRSPLNHEQELSSLLPGVELTTCHWDATEPHNSAQVIADAGLVLGSIDLVICAVGMLGHHAGRGMAPEAIELMVQTNFSGPAVALSAAAEFLAAQDKPATLLVLSSVAAARPRKSNFVYGSTKAALDSFSRGLGDALVDTGVRVIVLRPGFVRSRMTVGLEPAPFATDPKHVAVVAARALSRSHSKEVVWIPGKLRLLFAVFTSLPSAVWRRIAADR